MGIAQQLASPEYWLLHVLTPLAVTIVAGLALKWSPQLPSKWIENVLAANAAALPVFVAFGYSVFVGHWFFDLMYGLATASIYFAAARAPSISLKAFAFILPNALAVGLYLVASHLGLPDAGPGVLAIYPLIFIAVAPVIFFWLAALARQHPTASL